jgi:CubicO group peptidase (beta-lactamase class C family)
MLWSKGRWAFVLASIVLAFVVVLVLIRPDRALKAAAGLTAHNLCSATFVAGLDPDSTFRELVQPMLGAVGARLIHYRVDRKDGMVSASAAGLIHSTARVTPGYGCRIEYPDNLPAPPPQAQRPISDASPTQTPVAANDSAVAAAIDRVFAEDPMQPIKDVKAVVVVKDGNIVAERYAPGFGVNTPLLSYSVAKSFTNALLGILVRQGRLRVDQPVGAPEWTGTEDPRGKITIEDLLRMESGLDAAETGTGFDPVSQMELCQSDMAGFAAGHRLKEPPRTVWEYTSANTLILDRLLGDAVGGGAAGMRQFAERELFAPLHIAGATMEFDGKGVFVGASYVYAPARDFARLGQLYLEDGVAPDGRRILPEGWVEWSRRSTLGAAYGAGFWTNDGPSRFAQWRIARGFRKDGFFASGNLGQRIYIVPSKRVIVARFGYSRPPDFGIADDLSLIDAVTRSTVNSSTGSEIPLIETPTQR